MAEMSVVLKIVAFLLFVAIVFVVMRAARRGHAGRITYRRRFSSDPVALNQVPQLWLGADGSSSAHGHHGHHGHHHDQGGAHHGSHSGHAVGVDGSGHAGGGHFGGGFDGGGGHAGGGSHCFLGELRRRT